MKTKLIAIVLIMLGIVHGVRAEQEEESGAAPDASALVRLGKVESRVLPQRVPAHGTLQVATERMLNLALRHAGQVTRILVTPGSHVGAGDALLELAIAPAAHAEYLQAVSALQLARAEQARQQRLVGEKLSTGSQLDAATKALADATAQAGALREQGQDAQTETLRAAIPAVVTAVNVVLGERVAADTDVLTLAGEGKLLAVVAVEPEAAGQIRNGMPVSLRPVFGGAVPLTGVVESVGGLIDPQNHSVDVRVALAAVAATTAMPLPGSAVSAWIETAQGEGLAVPHSAVLRDEHGDASIYTVDNGVARLIAVETGSDRDGFIAVRGELSAGMPVVISGNYELADGMRVREETP